MDSFLASIGLLLIFNFLITISFIASIAYINYKPIDLTETTPVDQNKQYPLDNPRNLMFFMFNISKNIFGTALLFVPYTLARTGIIAGFVIMSFVYVVSAYLFILIGQLAHETNAETYSQIFVKDSTRHKPEEANKTEKLNKTDNGSIEVDVGGIDVDNSHLNIDQANLNEYIHGNSDVKHDKDENCCGICSDNYNKEGDDKNFCRKCSEYDDQDENCRLFVCICCPNCCKNCRCCCPCKLGTIVDFSIFINSIIINTSYILYICSRLQQLFGPNSPFSRWFIVIVLSFVFLFPPSLMPKIGNLKFLSFAGIIGLFIVMGGIIVIFFLVDTTGVKIVLIVGKPMDMFMVFPILVGNFNGHTNSVIFFKDFARGRRRPTLKCYIIVVYGSFFIVFGVCLVFGIFAALTIGEDALGDVLTNYQFMETSDESTTYAIHVFISCCSVFLIISTSITFMMYVNSIRVSMHLLFFDVFLRFCKIHCSGKCCCEKYDDSKFKSKPMTLLNLFVETFITVSLSALMSMVNFDLSFYMSLSIALFGTFIIYIFPIGRALQLRFLSNGDGSFFGYKHCKKFNVFLLLFGIFVSFFMASLTTIIDFVKK